MSETKPNSNKNRKGKKKKKISQVMIRAQHRRNSTTLTEEGNPTTFKRFAFSGCCVWKIKSNPPRVQVLKKNESPKSTCTMKPPPPILWWPVSTQSSGSQVLHHSSQQHCHDLLGKTLETKVFKVQEYSATWWLNQSIKGNLNLFYPHDPSSD